MPEKLNAPEGRQIAFAPQSGATGATGATRAAASKMGHHYAGSLFAAYGFQQEPPPAQAVPSG
jgi:hypothetical protein